MKKYIVKIAFVGQQRLFLPRDVVFGEVSDDEISLFSPQTRMLLGQISPEKEAEYLQEEPINTYNPPNNEPDEN